MVQFHFTMDTFRELKCTQYSALHIYSVEYFGFQVNYFMENKNQQLTGCFALGGDKNAGERS